MIPLAVLASPAVPDTLITPARAALLGTIQGLTEFLPVSSSAHLFVVPKLLGWSYGGLAFDVGLHGGTLLALLMAFGRDWWNLAVGAVSGDAERRGGAWRMLLWLVAATVPGAVAGKLLGEVAEEQLRSLPLQAVMLVVFGALLWGVDRFMAPGRDEQRPGWGTAAAMGFAQALALVPGVSRSGVTITAGRAAGLTRVTAARLSFMLATPITFGALLLESRRMTLDVTPVALAVGVATSAVVGLLAIRGLLRWLEHAGFAGFFAYRAALALLILVVTLRH